MKALFVKVGGYEMLDISKLMLNRLDNPSPMLCQHDLKAIGASAIRQFDDTKAGPKLRLSAAGSCVRQLAYSWHNYDASEKLNAASRLTFMVGDVTESAVVALIEEVGASLKKEDEDSFELLHTGAGQSSVYIDISLSKDQTLRVSGHPDGLLILRRYVPGSFDGEEYRAILEVKSMSDYGFKKFRKSGMTKSDSYYGQIQAYMLARSQMDGVPCEYTYIVAYAKSSGAKDAEFIDRDKTEWRSLPPLHGQWVQADPEYQQGLLDKYKNIATSDGPEEFERPYGPDKKGKLGFPCSYCSYMKKCFPDVKERAATTFWRANATKLTPFVEGQ